MRVSKCKDACGMGFDVLFQRLSEHGARAPVARLDDRIAHLQAIRRLIDTPFLYSPQHEDAAVEGRQTLDSGLQQSAQLAARQHGVG